MCMTLGLRVRRLCWKRSRGVRYAEKTLKKCLTHINVLVISVLQFLRLLCAYTVLYPTIVGVYFLRVRWNYHERWVFHFFRIVCCTIQGDRRSFLTCIHLGGNHSMNCRASPSFPFRSLLRQQLRISHSGSVGRMDSVYMRKWSASFIWRTNIRRSFGLYMSTSSTHTSVLIPTQILRIRTLARAYGLPGFCIFVWWAENLNSSAAQAVVLGTYV